MKQHEPHFIKSATACEPLRQWDKKGVTKDCKGMLITKNNRNVQNGHGHGISWRKQHKPIPPLNSNPRVPAKQHNPPCYHGIVSLRHVYTCQLHDFNRTTKTENWNHVLTWWIGVSFNCNIKACLHWLIWVEWHHVLTQSVSEHFDSTEPEDFPFIWLDCCQTIKSPM
jgi:hypothetical protein